MDTRRRRRTILLKFKSDVSQQQIDDLLTRIEANFLSMDGLVELEMGPQNFGENDFTHMICFVLEGEQALTTYQDDEEHKALRTNNFDLLEKALSCELILD